MEKAATWDQSGARRDGAEIGHHWGRPGELHGDTVAVLHHGVHLEVLVRDNPGPDLRTLAHLGQIARCPGEPYDARVLDLLNSGWK